MTLADRMTYVFDDPLEAHLGGTGRVAPFIRFVNCGRGFGIGIGAVCTARASSPLS